MLHRPIVNPRVAIGIGSGEDGYDLFDATTEKVHSLNLAASLIVEFCDGVRTADDIRALVDPMLGPGQEAATLDWLRFAAVEGLLVEADATHPALELQDWIDLSTRLRGEGSVHASYLCRVRVCELAPDDADQKAELAELAHILGRRAEAREYYEFYFERHPEDSEIEHVLIGLRDQAPPPRASDRCIETLYARFASNYDQSMLQDLVYEAPDRLSETLEATLGDRVGLDVLDLGCGTGLSGERLRPYAASLTGVDLSAAMLDLARVRGIYDGLERAEITAWLAACDRTFDLITACDALIYFGDLAQVVVPAHRLLRSGGLLVLTVEKGDLAPYRLTDNGRFAHHPNHVRTAAEASGFSVVSLEEVFLRYEYGEPVTGLVAVLAPVSAN